jgi:hypothetical protein
MPTLAKLADKLGADEAVPPMMMIFMFSSVSQSLWSQNNLVPRAQQRWEIRFAEYLSKFDLDKATDLGDRNVVRCSLEGVFSALTDLVERHVHPGRQRAKRNCEPCHLAGEESRDAVVQPIEFIDDA